MTDKNKTLLIKLIILSCLVSWLIIFAFDYQPRYPSNKTNLGDTIAGFVCFGIFHIIAVLFVISSHLGDGEEETSNKYKALYEKEREGDSARRYNHHHIVGKFNKILEALDIPPVEWDDRGYLITSAADLVLERIEERNKEFFRAGWERAKAHSNNPEPEPEKPYVSPERQELATILRVDVHCQEVSVWKKAKKAYALAHHPDRNQWADPELLGIMNALWDKVFG